MRMITNLRGKVRKQYQLKEVGQGWFNLAQEGLL
jgi:hypothetical protein